MGLGLGFIVRGCFSLSYMFQCGHFLLIQCFGVNQLASGSLLERIVPCVAVHVEYPWEKWDSGSSYVAFLASSLNIVPVRGLTDNQ